MKRIFNKDLLSQFFSKYKLENIFSKEVIDYMQLHFYERNERILEAESELEYYYMLVEGKIKISYLFENGKAMFLKFYTDFITIGDIELLKNKPIRCNVETVEESYLIAIPVLILRKQHLDNVNFLHHLINSLSEKLEATINNSSYNYIYPLINRLASYLIEHETGKDYIILNSSYKEIAQFLGTTYRHLSRTFKELEEKSIIRCGNKIVYIVDEDKLQDLSKNFYIKSL